MKSIRFTIITLLMIMISTLVLFTGCKQSNSYTIEGNITHADQAKVYLEDISGDQPVVIDTSTIKKNAFKMKGYANPGIYRLRFGEDPMSSVFLYVSKQDDIHIDADLKNLSEYTVEGSVSSLHIQQIMAKVQKKYKALEATFAQAKATSSTVSKDSIQRILDAGQKSLVTELKAFVEKEENPEVACFALMFFGPSIKEEIPYLLDVTEKLHKLAPDSKFVTDRYTSMQQYRDGLLAEAKGGIAVGSEAPNIILQSPSGDTIQLSSLRGQYVLLDFWASWCGPCRQENPNVVKVYKKYHAKGFDIFSVSLDANRDQWIRAISKDGLMWRHHGCDFGGWQSVPAQAYSIQAIPATFLLDKNGVVIAKDLRGEELDQKLNKLLNSPAAQ